jgi:membrane-associated protein
LSPFSFSDSVAHMMQKLIEFFSYIVDIFLHLDVHLAQLSAAFGPWMYLILFLIIFAETGLVVTPFLPGDSLLFAVGALTTLDGANLSIGVLWILLMLAAFLGDNLNYYLGRKVGPKIFSREKSWLLNPKNLQKTQAFYEKHGARTVIYARFVPIIRTFAPFVAGVGRMPYRRFMLFSLSASILWITGFLGAGYYFGNLPAVKSNFHIVIFTVIGVSILPMIISAVRSYFFKKSAA